MSIVSQLIGNGLRYWDFRSGTVDNLDPVALTPTFVGTPVFNRKGLKFNGTTDAVTYGNNLGVGTSQDFSMFAWVKTTSTGTITVAAKSGGSAPLYRFLISAGKALIQVNDGVHAAVTSIGTTNVNDGKWHFIAATLDRDGNQIIYTNGLPEDTDSIAGVTNTLDSVANFAIGRFGSSSSVYYDGSMACVGWYPGILTQTQIYQIMAETHPENMKWPTKPKSKTQATSLVNLADSGLSNAWKLEPIKNSIVDLVGSINGTSVGGVTYTERGAKFDGSTGYISVGDTSQTLKGIAVSFYNPTVKDKNTTAETLIGLKDGNEFAIAFGGVTGILTDEIITVLSSGGGRDGWTSASGSLSIGWHRLIVSFNETDWDIYLDNSKIDNATAGIPAAILADDVVFGAGKDTTVGRFSDCKIDEVEFFTTARSANWVATDYSNFAKQVQYKTDWGTAVSDAAVSAGLLEDTGWTVNSGSWKVSTDMINGNKVKVFECVTAGEIYIPWSGICTAQDAAYGTYDVWVKKVGTSNNLVNIFNHTTTGDITTGNNYNVIYRTDGTIDLRKGTNAVVDGGATAYALNTWHKETVKRRYDGQFELLWNDTSIGTATDTNYTTATYWVIDADAGDKIAIADIKGDHSIVKYLGI